MLIPRTKVTRISGLFRPWLAVEKSPFFGGLRRFRRKGEMIKMNGAGWQDPRFRIRRRALRMEPFASWPWNLFDQWSFHRDTFRHPHLSEAVCKVAPQPELGIGQLRLRGFLPYLPWTTRTIIVEGESWRKGRRLTITMRYSEMRDKIWPLNRIESTDRQWSLA